jgi:hypothetical protein
VAATGYAGGDPTKVNKAGDTMTGALVLPGDPTLPTQAADKHYVDTAIATASGAVVSVNGRTGAVTLSAADVAPVAESQVANLVADLAAKVALALVTAKGDLLAATGGAALARVGVGADGQVLTASSTAPTGVAWANGGFVPVFKQQYFASGDIAFPNTGGAFLPVHQASAGNPLMEVDIAASAGHLICPSLIGLRTTGPSALLDIGFIVGSSVVRFLSSGTSTPAADGLVSTYSDPTNFTPIGNVPPFVIASGDIDTGAGALRVVLCVNSNGTETLKCSAANEVIFSVINLGPHN